MAPGTTSGICLDWPASSVLAAAEPPRKAKSDKQVPCNAGVLSDARSRVGVEVAGKANGGYSC